MNPPVQHTILVVDDEPGMREMLSYELARDACEVEAVGSGQAAVEAVKRRKFDVAITDLKMPGMDGVATIEALRRADPDIEIIVATGYATIETAVACMKRGAYDYIEKPYDLDELKLLLTRALEKNHLAGVVALYDASRTILRTLDGDELVPLAASLAKRLLRADGAGLTQLAMAGAPERRFATHPEAEELLSGLEAIVERQRGPVVVSNAEVPLGGYASALVYPLPAHGDLIGCLAAFRQPGAPDFSASELQKGVVIANQVALALDNARLYGVLERKIYELVETQDRLVRAERLSMAGQLAGYVAHEINNPLSIVLSNLEALSEYAVVTKRLLERARKSTLVSTDDERVADVGEVVGEIRTASHRIRDLVASFGKLAARTPAPALEAIDLTALVAEWLSANPAARAVLSFDGAASGTVRIQASAVEIRAAIFQVLAFAASDRAAETPATVRKVSCARVGDWARLTIEGLDPRIEDEAGRLFDPRLHPDPESGGAMRLSLELTLAYEMIKRNRGIVAVRVKPEEGVRLELEFPAAIA